MALRYWISASRYFPSAKYFSPLSKYFCLRTFGSREHPKVARRREQANSRRTGTERLILDSPTSDRRGTDRPASAQYFMILHGNHREVVTRVHRSRTELMKRFQR